MEDTEGFGWIAEWFLIRGKRQWRDSWAPLGVGLVALLLWLLASRYR